MHKTYHYTTHAYTLCDEQRTGQVRRHPVIIVGAGPTGLTAANDLARYGVPVVVLDAENRVSAGSRAICFAKRSLEVFDRMGVVAPMRAKGVTWNTGKLFFQEDEVFRFDLMPQEGHAHPAFINLQQYYVEQYLVEGLQDQPHASIRWLNTVIDVQRRDDYVHLTVDTPDGTYDTQAEWVIAADGSRSIMRRQLGLDWEGVVFEEKFLIADVVMQADFPPERWFWFAPPFGNGHSTLLHMQPDNMWRIDFQLGRHIDPKEEAKPERVISRIKAMLGDDVPFELEWVSVYAFQSRLLENFVHGRVLFAGDAAHLMSVFGARGANSGIQDADNLVWKLKWVLDGKAPERLLQSYNEERHDAAVENLLYTSSSVNFISPNEPGTLALRNAVLELAHEYDFVRPLINSGRLSTATVVPESSLNTPDTDRFETPLVPGAPCVDAEIDMAGQPSYLLNHLGWDFIGLYYAVDPHVVSETSLQALTALAHGDIPVRCLLLSSMPLTATNLADLPVIYDCLGYLKSRYDLTDGAFYLVRPDQYICARWRHFDASATRAAVARACAGEAK